MTSPFGRYRVMAWVVGVLLVALTVGMVLKYGFDRARVVEVVAPTHGALFVVYLATAMHLALQRRWAPGFTVLVLLSGAVPFFSFVMERQVSARERSALPR